MSIENATDKKKGLESTTQVFFKYVTQNMLAMVGMSMYILADTYFISKTAGANGITALNLSLVIYEFMFALGSMIGTGAAIRFRIGMSSGSDETGKYFSEAVLWSLFFSLFFIIPGFFGADKVLMLLGADSTIVDTGTTYLRIVMTFAPMFMLNYSFTAFTRNDGAPTVAMVATITSTLFNIVFDYVLIFPVHMGMAGAALATALSPIISIGICCGHIFSKKSNVHFKWHMIKVTRLFHMCQLGVAAFVAEFASAVTLIAFNSLLLKLAGNVGVAAYGVIANVAMVVVAMFNGISNGAQPLWSAFCGKSDRKGMHKVLKLAIDVALLVAVIVVLIANVFPEEIVAIFNSEGDAQMASLAVTGVRLYFIGMLFAGFNIIATGYFSAVEKAGWAALGSISRGMVAIIFFAILLSHILGMPGIWISFIASEAATAVMMIIGLLRERTE